MTDGWEEINVPQGSFISWGSRPGQRITGKVIEYDPNGGTNFDGDPCPQITIRLSESATSINKEGEHRDFEPDEMVVINCGLTNLARGIKYANIDRGDMVDIHYNDINKVDKGDAKQFKIRVLRGSQARKESSNGGAPRAKQDAEIPF